jgi:hypothetical protein
MRKRGIVLKFLIELVLAAFIVLSIFGMSKVFGDETFFVQERIAHEGAVMIDALYAVPGNAWMSLGEADYDVELKEHHIYIRNEVNIKRPFPTINTQTATTKGNLIFSKNGDTVSLSNRQPTLNQRNCGAETNPSLQRTHLRITPETKAVALLLGLSACSENKCAISGTELSRAPETLITILPSNNGITASGQLGCHILNDIIKTKAVTTWYFPTDTINLEVHPDYIIDVGRALQQRLQR